MVLNTVPKKVDYLFLLVINLVRKKVVNLLFSMWSPREVFSTKKKVDFLLFFVLNLLPKIVDFLLILY